MIDGIWNVHSVHGFQDRTALLLSSKQDTPHGVITLKSTRAARDTSVK